MLGRPERNETAPYYYTYIDRVTSDDPIRVMQIQLEETLPFWSRISEQKSLHRYAPDKWSIRELAGHVTDTERAFVFRALWFARGFDTPLPGFDQDIAAAGCQADRISWASHVEEFRVVRLASLCFFRNLPADAWMKTGVASGNPFTVRSLAFIAAGHLAHHTAILRERYL